jgi:hypothetical protein
LYTCPHCNEPGISTWQKLFSVSFAPATCKLCQQQSYLHVVHGLYAMITWVILTWVFIGVALYEQKSIYLIGTFPSLFLAIDKCMLKAPMQGITKE